jgi:RNA polymerase sigma factor (sigma-70 family)
MSEQPKTARKPRYANIYAAFLQNESSIKRFIRRFLYKSEDIDEIAQETFLRAYRATGDRDVESPKAYLFQVARSLAYNELARKTRRLTDYLEEATDLDVSGHQSLEEELTAQQKIQLYFEAISDLPPQCRKVFLMRKVQAMPYQAIADALGISASAVEKNIARGTERCKQFMARREEAEQHLEGRLDPCDHNHIPGGR